MCVCMYICMYVCMDVCMCIYIYMYVRMYVYVSVYILYRKTFLNRPTMEPTLSGPLREGVGMGRYKIATMTSYGQSFET